LASRARCRMLAWLTDTTIPHSDVPIPGERPTSLAIRWVFPPGEDRLTRLTSGAIVFGRESGVDVSLAGPSVSRRHAEIRRQAAGVPMLRDLGSRNGVFLNGRRVAQAPLRLHDVVRFGDWVGVLTSVGESGAPCHDGATDWDLELVIPGYWAGPVLRARLAAARRIAETDLSIVIQGATGAGKEGAARAIHAWSKRPGPFLALNCAALPEPLAEGELFGYRKGAFSGADRPSPGFLRSAQGGTLFLDEIADLSLAVQAKLLRAIQEREVIPLGETVAVPIDVRILAATHVPLRAAVSKNRFRDDLFARLKGFILELPALRERVEEIPLLFAKLLAQRSSADRAPRLDAGAVEALCTHPWPHNMRDLTSLVVRLLAIYPDAPLVDRAMLEDLLKADVDGGQDAVDTEPAHADQRSEADPAAVLAALRRNRGIVRRAAADLGVGRGRLYRLMEKIDSLDLEQIRKKAETD
jgi:sigma-54 dependent transcriptional regulator, acetoin dehydrogenase operon transcriptional activator AcoR